MQTQNIAQLRAEVRRAHKLATQKVSRLRSRGIEVGGSSIDPRRDLANVKRYNTRQLQAYMRQLDTFRSRSTSYVAGADDKPISGQAWRQYKKLEKKYNEVAARARKRVENTFIPDAGMTVGQRDFLFRNTAPSAGGARRPMDTINRSPRGIVSERALRRLSADLERRLSPDFERKEIQRQRAVSRKMSRGQGNRAQRQQLARLTDEQFNILWNYTNFATLISTKYHTKTDSDSRWVARIRDDAESGIDELLSWAETL